MKLNIENFTSEIICDSETSDARLEAVKGEKGLELYLSAEKDRPRLAELYWEFESEAETQVLCDTWERSYANLEFLSLSENKRYMPWYFVAVNKDKCFCFGVRTGCNSFVSFSYDEKGIKAFVDCRNGGSGVHLDGRKICLATFVVEEYTGGDLFENMRDFLRKLCDNPVLPKERIYGGNNWYYAYGKSNYKQIVADARLQSELASGLENRPFQVIDDCWQKHKCEGPWLANRKFRDMKKLADEIKQVGARPGIWVRLLHNRDRALGKNMRILRGKKRRYLDPTHPQVQKYIRADIERIKSWGYELIKHDFSTFDLFGLFPGKFEKTVVQLDNWHFYDKSKTNAEIVLDFYRLVLDAAGDMLIIGCDTLSHLSAGLVHIYRTGDDTSGREWKRTKEMGVNTLAFRLAQNEIFYMCDADCVGILKDKVPWEKNSQWLHLLSYSNTPLFISCTDEINEKKRADIKEAYRVFNQPHEIKPVDIFGTRTPEKWLIDGKEVKYSW